MDAHAREPSGGVESAEDGFLSRASRGSVAFRVGESRRARRSTPYPVSSLEFQTVHRPTTQQATSNLAPRAEIFFLHAKGHPHCPPRFGRGSSPPTRRDGVEVGPETRDRGVRRGDARPRRRQRARAPGRSHREQVRRACVTKDTAERNASSPPTPTSRATVQEADPRARDPRRAARRKRPPKSGGGDARTIARSDTARAAPREPIPRRRSGQSFFVLSFRHTGVPPFSRTPPGLVGPTRKGTETSIRVLFFFSDPLSSRAIASTPTRNDFSHSPSR